MAEHCRAAPPAPGQLVAFVAMLRLLLRALVLLVVVGGLFYFWLLVRTGELRSLEPLAVGECVEVEGAPGAEDLTIHRGSGMAFVSSTDRRRVRAGESVSGRILAYDLESRTLADVTPEAPAALQPHGISLYEDGRELLLFVVNHAGGRHAVEILAWDGNRFVHRETVTGDLLISPNDLVAVGPRSFYVTNDHGAGGGWRRRLEDALFRAKSTVVYYDGEKMSIAADRLAYANGIAISRFGRELYVGGSTRGVLYIFGRDVDTGELGAPFEMPLGTGVDNLEVDRHGMLWIAAHPKLLTFFRHSRDAERLSPSQVLWVDTDQNADPPVRPVYLNLGEELSGASVAVPWGNRLLIGSVFENFLDCTR